MLIWALRIQLNKALIATTQVNHKIKFCYSALFRHFLAICSSIIVFALYVCRMSMCFIWLQTHKVSFSSNIWIFVFQGRTALWDSILILCHRIKYGYGGIIRGMHLGSSALCILPVLDSESEDWELTRHPTFVVLLVLAVLVQKSARVDLDQTNVFIKSCGIPWCRRFLSGIGRLLSDFVPEKIDHC